MTRTPPPAIERVSFRQEQPEDEQFLCRLYATTRIAEMALTGWPAEQQEAFLRQQFQFQTLHYRRYYSGASFEIILQDERPIGRIYIHRGGDDIRLMDIALLPEYRGSGIGTWIMHNLLDESARSQKPVTLHVEPYNPAVRLYLRLGFRLVEQRGMNLFMEWRGGGENCKEEIEPQMNEDQHGQNL
jgi:ribosomal protein S18 acetylase RimI-like enzyme